MTHAYFVKAGWDAEASVWISESNIPGLVIEAETLTEFEELMNSLAPEMLAENVGIHNERVQIDFRVDETRELLVG